MKNPKMFIQTALSIILCLIIFHPHLVSSQTTLVAPVHKDAATSLYTLTLSGTDRYVIDTIALFSWQRCPTPPPSSFFRFSSPCFPAQSRRVPYCYMQIPDDTSVCFVTPANPITQACAVDLLVSLNLTVSWADGANPTGTINTSLSCAPESLFQSLPAGIVGLASFSTSPLSLQVQFSATFPDVESKFAMCLPRTGSSGVIFFGGGPYKLESKASFDASILISYAPLHVRGPKPSDYNYGLGPKALSVGGKSIPLYVPSSSLFNMVTISTTLPYTYISSRLYNQFIEFFTEGMKDIPRVEKVEPFSVCYNTTTIGHDGVGLDVPKINLEFDNGTWTFHRSNSMTYVGVDVACLAILEGIPYINGFAITLGTFQMEENLLVFEAFRNRNSRFGFSSSLNHQGISCENLNLRADV